MKITYQLLTLMTFVLCYFSTIDAMRRVKSSSNIPQLKTIIKNQELETVSPQSPLAPLSDSPSTYDVDKTGSQTPQPKGTILYLSIKNPFPHPLILHTTYHQTTPLVPSIEPFIFEQTIQPGSRLTDPINHHIQLEKTFFALSSISIINPENKNIIKKITEPDLFKNFLNVTLQEPSTSTNSQKIRKQPITEKKWGSHVRRGEKRPTSPSVILPPHTTLSSPSLPISPSTKRPPLSPTSPHVSTRTQSGSMTPSADLSTLPTTPPSDF